MTERESQDKTIRQNVRVGDNLGIRLTGEGSRLDLRPERRMSEAAFFKDIYVRANDGGELIRIKPDLSITHLIRLGDGENSTWVKSSLQNPTVNDCYPSGVVEFGKIPGFLDDTQGEIVVIPEFVYQTPELLSMIPESTIADEFSQIEASLSNPQ